MTTKFAEVQSVCREATGPYTEALMIRFGVGYNTAKNMVTDARKAGFEIPHVNGEVRKRWIVARLICECGESASMDEGIPALVKHCRTAHGRRPSPLERTPRKDLT